jgi:hypothetical protein
MRKELLSILVLCILVASTSVGCGQEQSTSTPSTLTMFSISGGNVSVEKAGTSSWIEGQAGASLGPGDIIKSGDNSSAEITFLDGTTIELQGGTEIEVDTVATTDTGSSTIIIKQTIGSIIFRVTKIVDPASRYEVETPAGVVAVRGSAMQVYVIQDGTTWVSNLEGDIWAIAQGVELQVPEGRQGIIRVGQPPELIVQDSYIIVHALNPEGVEIVSIKGMDSQSVEVYDGPILIGYGAYNEETSNKLVAISAGEHTIEVRFNGMVLQQEIEVNAGETEVSVFTFERTTFDVWAKIPESQETTVAISGSWVGATSLIEDRKSNDLGWNVRVHFEDPYDGGYDEEGNYVKSSGSYNGVARASWVKQSNQLNYELYTNYDLYADSVPARPPDTPLWSSLVDGSVSSDIVLGLENPDFSNWFVQYSNYCTDLSLQIGSLELLDHQGDYIMKSVPAADESMRIESARIETWGGATDSITKTGGGALNIEVSSVPYDLTGTGIKHGE